MNIFPDSVDLLLELVQLLVQQLLSHFIIWGFALWQKIIKLASYNFFFKEKNIPFLYLSSVASKVPRRIKLCLLKYTIKPFALNKVSFLQRIPSSSIHQLKKPLLVQKALNSMGYISSSFISKLSFKESEKFCIKTSFIQQITECI